MDRGDQTICCIVVGAKTCLVSILFPPRIPYIGSSEAKEKETEGPRRGFGSSRLKIHFDLQLGIKHRGLSLLCGGCIDTTSYQVPGGGRQWRFVRRRFRLVVLFSAGGGDAGIIFYVPTYVSGRVQYIGEGSDLGGIVVGRCVVLCAASYVAYNQTLLQSVV